MKWLQQKLNRWRLAQTFAAHWPEAPAEEPEWEDEDAAALKEFLATRAGRKILAKMRYLESLSNAQAVMVNNRLEWACGWAAGVRGGFAWLINLSRGGIDSAETDEDPAGAPDDLDRFAP